APADPDPGGKDRLAGPHVARKANHISGLKELSKPHTETSGLFCAVCDNVKFAVSEDGHTWLRLGRWVNLERLYYAGQVARKDNARRNESGVRPHLPRRKTRARDQGRTRQGLLSSPSPSIETVTTSPSFRKRGGFMPIPTPGGVPVRMTSPGSSVKCCDRYEIRVGILKIRLLVLLSCMISPLMDDVIRRLCGSGISSRVTSHGPSGQNVSRLLPRVHCRSLRCCRSRALTSLAHISPKTCSIASSSEPSLARLPMTTASSASQSTSSVMDCRHVIGSFGPITALGNLAKISGLSGTSLPVSFAWSA